MKPQNPHRLDQRDRHGASRRGVFSDTNTSFVVSTGLHVLLFMLLGIGGAKKVHDTVKLTEISYIEERYGQEVAKKVTVAPQKVAAVQARPAEAPKLEGSIFAKAEPKGLHGLVDVVRNPRYATGTGLVLCGVNRRDVQWFSTRQPRPRRSTWGRIFGRSRRV